VSSRLARTALKKMNEPKPTEAETRGGSCAPAPGSVTAENLIRAFVQGAQWWEYEKTGATMWASDRNHAEGEAILKHREGKLGKSPNAQAE
jgi:hypothetical protein